MSSYPFTVIAKLKSNAKQAIDFERVKLVGDEVDLHGRRITSMLRSVGGDIEIIQYAINSGPRSAKRWTAQIARADGTKFMVSSSVKTRKEVMPDVRFYMRAYQGRLR